MPVKEEEVHFSTCDT